MMKVGMCLVRIFPKSSIGATMAWSSRYITFKSLRPKSILSTSPPPPINPSSDRYSSLHPAQHVQLQQNVQTQELHQLHPLPLLPRPPPTPRFHQEAQAEQQRSNLQIPLHSLPLLTTHHPTPFYTIKHYTFHFKLNEIAVE